MYIQKPTFLKKLLSDNKFSFAVYLNKCVFHPTGSDGGVSMGNDWHEVTGTLKMASSPQLVELHEQGIT